MSDFMFKKMPATRWEDALPLGNGNIGALVFGNIQKERIVLNNERLFRYQKTPDYEPFYKNLKEIRSIMLEGRYDYALKLFNERFKACCKEVYNVDPYQPFGELFMVRKPNGAFTGYSAMLDFKTATASVTWKENENVLKRETFVSYDTGVICTKLSSSINTPLDLRIYIDPVAGGSQYLDAMHMAGDGCYIYSVKYKNGREHGAVAYAQSIGGTVTCDEGAIQVKSADIIYVFVKEYIYEDPKKAIARIVKEIKKLDYEKLHRKHVKQWKEAYGKITLDIGQGKKTSSNEEYLLMAYEDKKPRNLFHTMFNYGRYLLISSSKQGGLPANMQGIWNGEYNPKWDSDIHNDVSIQMNYWCALPGGMNEQAMAFYDYFDSMIPDFRENARKIYGCRGILVPVCMSTHGQINGSTGLWQSWISAGGWISRQYFDYWLYTDDSDFLKRRAVRFMKEVALFYEDFLITGKNGKYMFIPSVSPENVPVTEHPAMLSINATMDIAIARDVLHNLIFACQHLEIEEANIAKWQDMLDKMPEYELNSDKAMKEWLYEGLNDNYHHRHQSHIYPFFPGTEITKENNRQLYDGIKLAVEKRLTIGLPEQVGWSYANMANIYARLEDGEKALECLNYVLRACTGQNLFTYHNDWRDQGLTLSWFGKDAPFQIDANFGFTAAIFEMLIYSKPAFIRLVPAVPDEWSKGSIKGVHTRCMMECDIEWDMKKHEISLGMSPHYNYDITVEIPFIVTDIQTSGCRVIRKNDDGGHTYVTIHVNHEIQAQMKVN
ncbi:MAG: glycoside hydrolase N-terminal domain-containing protein [Clostridia bacterium]